MKNVVKSFGIVKLELYYPNFDTNSIETQIIYQGALCINLNENLIITPYISCVKSAKFISYDRIISLYGCENNIRWENEHNILYVSMMSKMWDYITFVPIHTHNLTFITFKNVMDIDKNKKYNIYGIKTKIIINRQKSINLIHNKLAKQEFYIVDYHNTFPGSLLYYKVPSTKNIHVIGLLSYDNRLLSLQHLKFKTINIDLNYDFYKFDNNILIQMNKIYLTLYPKLKSNFKLLQKNDIILEINGKTIKNCQIYCYDVNKKLCINEYLIYLSQHCQIIKFVIVRNNEIRYIDIQTDKMNKELKNKIEMKSKKDIKYFSADVCDKLILQNKYSITIDKYLTNPYYKVKEKFFI